MTREEAIKEIEDRVQTTEYIGGNYVDCVDIEALRMAIEALQRSDHIADGGKKDEHLREVTKKVDVISRQAAIEDAREAFKRNPTMAIRVMDLIKSMPSAQPAIEERMEESAQNVPNGELISRKAAIDAVRNFDDCENGYSDTYDKAFIISALEELPSTQPEIVRCKDCKYYKFADNRAFGMPVKMCEWFGFEDVDGDDFCSRAERSEG